MENLPEELLMKIFQMVSREDLRNIVLVCRNWRQIGETPSLWSSLCISVNTSNVSVIPDILTMHRMSASTKLVIHGTVLSKEVTEAIVEHPGLKEVVVQPGNGIEIPLSVLSCISSPGCQVTRLDFSWNDLSGVDPGLLVKVVTKLETLKVRNTRLTQQQTAAIFTAVSEGNKIANQTFNFNLYSNENVESAYITLNNAQFPTNIITANWEKKIMCFSIR